MTAVFAGRRRAEEFAALLEHPQPAPGSADQRALLELVAALRATPDVEPRPEFTADLRARLMVAADTLLVPTTEPAPSAETRRLTLPPAQKRRDRRLAALVGGLALAGATGSVAVAAQDALPGEALYPVKRAIEDVRTGATSGDADRGAALLATAATRLDEVTALSRGGAPLEDLAVADALEDFGEQATEASGLLLGDHARNGTERSVARLRDFDAASLARLEALEPRVPPAARDELMDAARLLFRIDAAAERACPVCGGAGIREIPGVFAPVASGPARVVVPSSTLEPRQRPEDPEGPDDPDDGASGSRTPPLAPTPGTGLPTGALPPGSVTADRDGAHDGGGADGDGLPDPGDDPVGTLTDVLPGDGALPGSGGGPSPSGIDRLLEDAGIAVEDVTGGISSGVTGRVTERVGGLVDPVPESLAP